ncbi:hypothetical protein AVEN_193979-1 [Araneus ventricosus]|uniref:Uncharacterized protein n=1 Tax=Araneus ventricosus TaxID=182803 RepID=A0A4Y2TFB4_ARAVE|nr:hypothetical protein AVEN_193979-1 [Araneus ventricosus]
MNLNLRFCAKNPKLGWGSGDRDGREECRDGGAISTWFVCCCRWCSTRIYYLLKECPIGSSVSRAGRRYGSIKESPAMATLTLMLKCCYAPCFSWVFKLLQVLVRHTGRTISQNCFFICEKPRMGNLSALLPVSVLKI